jgi:hypothetical protein
VSSSSDRLGCATPDGWLWAKVAIMVHPDPR